MRVQERFGHPVVRGMGVWQWGPPARVFNSVHYRIGTGHLQRRRSMAKEQRFVGTSPRLGPHASRRGLLQSVWAIVTLALGQRAALGQGGGAHAHMSELGVANLPVAPAMDQPLI